jgi:hypothetical protein
MTIEVGHLVYNAIRTPDGTLLESTSRHDYKEHVDRDGKTYMVDGGLSYARRNSGNYEELSLRYGDSHADIREVFTWGTYGPKGDQPFTHVLLKNMSEGHLNALIAEGYYMAPVMQDELTWRDNK